MQCPPSGMSLYLKNMIALIITTPLGGTRGGNSGQHPSVTGEEVTEEILGDEAASSTRTA